MADLQKIIEMAGRVAEGPIMGLDEIGGQPPLEKKLDELLPDSILLKWMMTQIAEQNARLGRAEITIQHLGDLVKDLAAHVAEQSSQ